MMFRTCPLLFTVLLLSPWLESAEGKLREPQDQPNVIVLYTDDQGSVDVGCYGARDLITPQLDRLARRAIRFTQFYSAAPVCSPSRAAMLTGRYPQRAGLAGNAGSQPGSEGMPAEQLTLAELFQQEGYATGHVGKWHLGYVPATMPNGQGFDFSFGHMGGCIDNYSHFFYWSGPNRHDLWLNGKEVWHDGEFFPDLMVEHASAFIERNRDRPFFLYWPINVPHYPLQGTDKWRAKYRHLDPPRRMYAAFISTMDEMIGNLLAEVEKLGLSKHTIVIFQSDHGHSTEVRTFGGGGSSGPYRGAKFSLLEGGIRVPAMISWPGQLPQGEQRGQMAVSVDWFPTVAKLAGITLPDRVIDGKDLGPLLASSVATSPHEVFHWQSGRGMGGKPQWAVRQGDWKLIVNPRDTSDPDKPRLTAADQQMLIHISEDPAETRNLAASQPQRVKKMQALHEAWLKEVSR